MTDPTQSVDHHLRRIWQEAVDRRGFLPGEHALAAELGVSRPRVRERLIRLELEGLISRRRGADTVVNVAASDVDVRFDMAIDYVQMLQERGFDVKVEVLSASIQSIGERDAQFFDVVAPDWTALNVVKRWRANGEVFVVADDLSVIPSEVHLEDLDLSTETAALVEQVRGITTEWTIVEPGAVILDETDANCCERAAGSVALTMETSGVGLKGEKTFRARELLSPGRVRFGFIRNRPTIENP